MSEDEFNEHVAKLKAAAKAQAMSNEPSQRTKDLASDVLDRLRTASNLKVTHGMITELVQAALDAERADALRHIATMLKARLKRGDNMADMGMETRDIIKATEAESSKLQSP